MELSVVSEVEDPWELSSLGLMPRAYGWALGVHNLSENTQKVIRMCEGLSGVGCTVFQMLKEVQGLERVRNL